MEESQGSCESADVSPLRDCEDDNDNREDYGPCTLGFSADTW